MSNITEKQFKDWFFKNCTEKQGSELNPPKVSLAPYDLYKKLWKYFEAALQNKVSDPATPELDKERDIKEAERLWNIPNKLEAVKLIIKWGYSLKDAKAYCENNFNREVSDVSAEEILYKHIFSRCKKANGRR